MFVKAKQSGELLTREVGEIWSPEGVMTSARKIERAYHQAGRLGLEGLMVVSGAGNIIRGKGLKEKGLARGVEDVIGRLATIQNTLILSAALSDSRVPNTVFVADNMGFSDATIGRVAPYDIEAERAAYAAEQVVLIAGGTGEDGKTTDNAVLDYASRHTAAYPNDGVVVLKGTKFDGVYDSDPAKHAGARRYAQIPAPVMLADYERFAVVDMACLEAIQETGLSMRVYRDGDHDLEAALATNGSSIGTLIVPQGNEPVFA